MNFKKLTIIVSLTITGIIVVYDSIAMIYGGLESTMSHMFWEVSFKQPIIPFGIGVVMGHLFWSKRE